MNTAIGRKNEFAQLRKAYESGKSEFVIIYGRRRIGKTFLVRQFFNDNYTFYFVGRHGVQQEKQLQDFGNQLKKYSHSTFAPKLQNWDEAFNALTDYLELLPKEERKVIFIDEMPWIDTHKSGFVSALEYFWNSWVAMRDDIMLVACGSATSWMTDKLSGNRGGLHNRITRHIYLRPFTLNETEQYLESQGCHWDRLQITQAYMVFGGIPFYLSLIDKDKSLVQNIDNLLFTKKAPLHNEFTELYNALFKNADRYIAVVKALSERREGMTRQELVSKTGISGGNMTKILSNLELCDFILSFAKFKCKKNGLIYRLSDFYTLFYFKFMHESQTKDTAFWAHNFNSQQVAVWQGFTFELICLLHSDQIKKKIGILGIATSTSTWRDYGNQIDMLIDRADRIINLCEIKYSSSPYTITKEYEEKLRMRMSNFKDATRTNKSIINTFITTYGVTKGKHSAIAEAEVTMEDLFE